MNIQQSEIWLVDLNPTKGDEINKTRPCVVVNDDNIGVLKSRVVIPITGWNDIYRSVPWMIKIEPDTANDLAKISAADTFQVRNVSNQRFVKKIGSLAKTKLFEIHTGIAKVLLVNYTLS